MPLKMKGHCERCKTALAHDAEAYICSYECTFCPACTEEMVAVCKNCEGELIRRPRRTTPILTVAARIHMRWWTRLLKGSS
ncbi:MAG TPA: DUF1272 domain-containing protein [Pyrinomonadaceae bacterium]|jgi:hypothetical protein